MAVRASGWCGVGAVGAAAMLIGCAQADYGADIHNKTAAPVFAQIMVKAHGQSEPAVLGASKRLGPGDRAFVGSVRAADRAGMAYMVVDNLPSQSKSVTVDLAPGMNFYEVFDDGGVIRVMPKP